VRSRTLEDFAGGVQRAGNFLAGSGDSTASVMQFKTYTLTFTLLLLTSACPGKPGEDTDGTTDPTTTTSSSTTDDMPTTDPTSTGGTTDDALTTEADPTAATEGEDTTSADTDTEPGPISPELESACRAACQNEIMCEEESDDDVDECVIGCGVDFGGLPAECDAQTLGFLNCIGTSSCLDLEGQIEEGACAEEFAAWVECTEMGPVGCIMGLSEGRTSAG
jgi:hypothetical protein